MVNFRIYGATAQPRSTQPQVVTLALKPYKDGVRIVAVDEATGKQLPDGNLVKVTPQGVYLYHTVNPALGLPLNSANGAVAQLVFNPHR